MVAIDKKGRLATCSAIWNERVTGQWKNQIYNIWRGCYHLLLDQGQSSSQQEAIKIWRDASVMRVTIPILLEKHMYVSKEQRKVVEYERLRITPLSLWRSYSVLVVDRSESMKMALDTAVMEWRWQQ